MSKKPVKPVKKNIYVPYSPRGLYRLKVVNSHVPVKVKHSFNLHFNISDDDFLLYYFGFMFLVVILLILYYHVSLSDFYTWIKGLFLPVKPS